ncbi:Putative beta-1,3-glucanase, Osmotin/thaumatin-like superfamily, glucan endo-1,3-beta-glucosidase [Septoria linicola]|uniref:Beta-1,3-glucanase, Osmotin/thaumatin-like superfamily, glucan endo-1,3-beta-glucosidase n=1 Tax=Septoria linicola TaxID=215465 RepID=A0A9Q9AW48_9PEZI|nr:Putative beta-1,3-glucanase, Osmotin/thaumatin-like superfamily, glucan endo-1,3-beta-glucosidase [Septoria linicola]
MPDSLQIALKNDSDLDNIHAYVTGIAIQHEGKRCLLKANGKDLYFPQEVKDIGSQLAEDCAIPLGPPGNTANITIPQLAGGRIWIVEGLLTFLLNPGGPALVEPSVLNPSDPNADSNFGFAEFTLNDAQLYANISYVDFVPRIPIAITLQTQAGDLQHVAGMAPDGLDRMAESLVQQSHKDSRPWDKLVINKDNRNLRILNATHGGAVGASFDGYFEPYVDEVWSKYKSNSQQFRINTQAGPGILSGHITSSNNLLIGDEEFSKPTTSDIFGCNSGPFTTGPSATRNAIIPRLAASFVRTSLLDVPDQPSQPSTFYTRDPTNHYARLVHEHNIDRKGYAFAYDDVQPDGGEDQSGKVNAGDPVLFTVTVGGKSAASGAVPQQQQQSQAGNFDRPPPPPPAETRPDQGRGAGGFGGKLFGKAKEMLRR